MDHAQPRSASLSRTAARATLHCLTGCAIGEVLGMVIGTGLGLSNAVTVVLSIALAFFFGYSLTMLPLVRSGLALALVIPIAFASDTFSIAVMEIVDNGVMIGVPGALNAGLADILFWGALGLSLVIAFAAAFPVNRYLIARGSGHAVVHGLSSGGTLPANLNPRRLVLVGVLAIAVTITAGAIGASIATRDEPDTSHTSRSGRVSR